MRSVSSGETNAHHATRTVQRACAVLSAFGTGEPELTLRELSERVALPKATVHRLAGSLAGAGFLEHRANGHYALGLRLSELGALARANLDVVSLCSSALDALAAATQETVLLVAADWDALEMTVLGSRVSPYPLAVSPHVGERMTIPPGCLGKALLLGLPEAESTRVLSKLPLPALTSKTHTDRRQLERELALARDRGFAVADDEYIDGVCGAAVPVLFDVGRPRAAIGVVGPSARMAGRSEEVGALALALTATLRPAQASTAQAAA